MTLLDWPGKVACTVFLEGCALRCPYCHNSELLLAGSVPGIREEELLFLSGKKKRASGRRVRNRRGRRFYGRIFPFFWRRSKRLDTR